MDGIMTNKEKYRNAFAGVHPSDGTVERIIKMAQKRTLSLASKKIIIAAAVLVALFCCALTVNAATDGALFDGIKVFLNGEEVAADQLDVSYGTAVAENGETVYTMTVEIPSGMLEDSTTVEIVSEDGSTGAVFVTGECEAYASVTVGESK